VASLSSLDWDAFERCARSAQVLPLVGVRVCELAPAAVPEWFRSRIDSVHAECRLRALLAESTTTRTAAALEERGVEAVPFKGSALALSVFDEPALRGPSSDLDLLVRPADVPRAIAALAEAGYDAPREPVWSDGMPGLFECSLAPDQDWLPPIDLHWRTHWYETGFTSALVDSSATASVGWRRAAPAYELAALLLCFARDGFWGLRLPADVAAWWDSLSGSVEERALDVVVQRHPELAGPIVTAASVVEQLVGLPASRVVTQRRLGRRERRAGRLLNWTGAGTSDDLLGHMSLVDWLLAPRGGRVAFLRRHLFLPSAVIVDVYGLPESARVRRLARCLWYAGVKVKNLAPALARSLWGIRGGRTWTPVPSPKAG
jgi:hypothetical protein